MGVEDRTLHSAAAECCARREWFPAISLPRIRQGGLIHPSWLAYCKPHARLPAQGSTVGQHTSTHCMIAAFVFYS
jgi:hypothetical protein